MAKALGSVIMLDISCNSILFADMRPCSSRLSAMRRDHVSAPPTSHDLAWCPLADGGTDGPGDA